MLTGDSLFVGDIARPDLAVEKGEGARGIFRSLHERCWRSADDVEVWPGHLGGSLCGGPWMDLKVSSTIGFERRHNALLGVADEDEFVERTTAEAAPAAAELQGDRGAQPRAAASAGRRCAPAHAAPGPAGSTRRVIDIRTALQFDDAHIPGAICNTILQAGFGTRLAWIAGPEQEVVLVGRDDADALRAAELAAAVGVGRIAGYLAGGMTSWREERLPVASIERMTVPELARAARRAADPRRARARRVGGGPHPGLGVHALPRHPRAAGGDRPGRPVAVICASGQRAAVGASLRRSATARAR